MQMRCERVPYLLMEQSAAFHYTSVMCLSFSDLLLGNMPSLQFFWRRNNMAWESELKNTMSFCDQILAITQTPKLLYLSGNDYDGDLYTTPMKLIVRCILSKSVNTVHIKPAHHESLLFFFSCFLEYQDYIYIICKNHIIWARRTRSTGDGSWLHFQTRLPVVCLCILLWALVILQLWSSTYPHFQILKAREMSTLVPKKGNIFFLYDFVFYTSLSFTQFAISSDHQWRAAGPLWVTGETTQILTPASGTHTDTPLAKF